MRLSYTYIPQGIYPPGEPPSYYYYYLPTPKRAQRAPHGQSAAPGGALPAVTLLPVTPLGGLWARTFYSPRAHLAKMTRSITMPRGRALSPGPRSCVCRWHYPVATYPGGHSETPSHLFPGGATRTTSTHPSAYVWCSRGELPRVRVEMYFTKERLYPRPTGAIQVESRG